MDCSMPGFPVHHQLPEFMQTHVHWVGDAIQPSHPLSSPSPAFNLSQHQGLFQWVSSSYQVAKVLELQPQAYSRLISFRMDWLDLLAVQGTLKSLLQHHNSKTSILWCSDITLPTKVHLVKAMFFPVVMYGCESWTIKKAEYEELMVLNHGAGEDSWEPLRLQGDQTSQS